MFNVVIKFEACNMNPFMDLCGSDDRNICINETISEKVADRLFEEISVQMQKNSVNIMIAASRYNSAKLFKVNDIYYIESFGNLKMISSEGETFEFYGTLNRITPVMKRFGFIRVNQSYIISPKHIRCVRPRSVEMADGKLINVGRKYLSHYREAIKKLNITELNEITWRA